MTEKIRRCGIPVVACFAYKSSNPISHVPYDLSLSPQPTKARVFTRDPARYADASALEGFDSVSTAIVAAHSAAMDSSAAAAAFQHRVPIQVSSGTSLDIVWNDGESAGTVADRFIATNKLGADQREALVQFVAEAMVGRGGSGNGTGTGAVAAGSSSSSGSGGGAGYDFSFPVELSQGGKLMIEWNRSEQAEVVADRFLAQYGLGADNRPDIIEFVKMAQGQVGEQQPTAQAAAPPGPDDDAKAAMIAQMCSMGFDAGTARNALESAAWSVDGAMAVMFS